MTLLPLTDLPGTARDATTALRGGGGAAAFRRAWAVAARIPDLARASGWLGALASPPPHLRSGPLLGSALSEVQPATAATDDSKEALRRGAPVPRLKSPEPATRSGKLPELGKPHHRLLNRPESKSHSSRPKAAPHSQASPAVAPTKDTPPRPERAERRKAVATSRRVDSAHLRRLADGAPIFQSPAETAPLEVPAPRAVRRLPAPPISRAQHDLWQSRLAERIAHSLGKASRNGSTAAADGTNVVWQALVLGPEAPLELLRAEVAGPRSKPTRRLSTAPDRSSANRGLGPDSGRSAPTPVAAVTHRRGPAHADSLPFARRKHQTSPPASGKAPTGNTTTLGSSNREASPALDPEISSTPTAPRPEASHPLPPTAWRQKPRPAPGNPDLADLHAPHALRPPDPQGPEATEPDSDDLSRLARRMERILAEEARRHGIDV